MSDERFFTPEGPLALAFLAETVGGVLVQPERANQLVHDIADLDDADENDLSVFCDLRHAPAFARSHAGVIVTSNKLSQYPHNGSTLILAPNPRLAFAELGRLFYPAGAAKSFIHPRATVAASARIGADVTIEAGAVIGEGATIGAGSRIGANTVIGDGAKIAGKSGVMRDVEAGQTVAGYPAMAIRQWHRQTAALAKLAKKD